MPQFMAQWTNMMGRRSRDSSSSAIRIPSSSCSWSRWPISIGTEPLEEIETRFVDLMMARPLRRTTAINRTLVVLVVAIVIALAACSWRRSAASGCWRRPRPAHRNPASSSRWPRILRLLVLAWGGIALAIASCARRRATAGAATGFLAFATFVLDYAGKFWARSNPSPEISPLSLLRSVHDDRRPALSTTDVAALTRCSPFPPDRQRGLRLARSLIGSSTSSWR